jgi:hypothetical protein
MATKLQTYQETEAIFNEILQDCKSPRSVKIRLTKLTRETEEILEEYKEILSRPMSRRYRLGEFVNRADLYNARLDLRVLRDIKNRLLTLKNSNK